MTELHNKRDMTEETILAKLDLLQPISDDQRNAIVCSLVGHSKIQSAFFGYFYCGRCNAQVGDQLGSIYDATSVVIIGHACGQCRENFDRLGWEHKLFVADPFVTGEG